MLASPDIDFVCSPTSYAFRQLGGAGTSHFMSLVGSVKLHGKLWFDENDIRTSLSGGQVGEWGRPADVAGDLLQQDKELANCMVNGAPVVVRRGREPLQPPCPAGADRRAEGQGRRGRRARSLTRR